MDLKGFKKVGQTKSHTIFEHPEGHVIHVANAALTAPQKKEAKAIPTKKMADGGSVGDEVAQAEQGQAPNIPITNVDIGDVGQEVAVPQQQVLGQEGLNPTGTSVPTPQENPYLQGVQTEAGLATQGLQNQEQGVQSEANAAGELGNKQAKAIGDSQAASRKSLADYQTSVNELNTERKAFLDDKAHGYIDPNHYWANQSTGQRIGATIGLLLGGLGSGGDPSKNAALVMLNHQIDNDLQSQLANQSMQKSLLQNNLEHFKNTTDAAQFTRVQMRDAAASELEKQAALMKNPQAQAAAQQHIGALMQQSAAEMGDIATRRAAYSGQQGQNLPATMDPAFDRRVEVGNSIFHANDKESADKLRPQLQALDTLEDVIGRVDNFNKEKGPTTGLPTQAGGEAQGLNRETEAAIAKVEASGGQLGRLVDKFKEMAPVAGSILPSRGAGRSKSIHDFIAAQKAALVKNNLSTGLIVPERRGKK